MSAAAIAYADVKGFNTKVLASDFGAAAEVAAATWPELDKARQDAPLIAREFAFVSMLARRPDIAEPIARWLFAEGAVRDGSGIQPLTASVLYRWSVLGEGNDKSVRLALLEALKARAASPDAGDRVSVAAGNRLMSVSWREEDWKGVVAVSNATAVLAEALGEEGLDQRDRARLYGIAAAFVDEPDGDPYLAMLRLYSDLTSRTPDSIDGRPVSSADQTRDAAFAWATAMEAYFAASSSLARLSGGSRNRLGKGEAIEAEKLKAAECGLECQNQKRIARGEPPLCVIDYRNLGDRLVYPKQPLGRMVSGAVYLGLDTDENGVVGDIRLLAAVPTETFPQSAMAGVRGWQTERNAGKSAAGCTMAGTRTLTVVYRAM